MALRYKAVLLGGIASACSFTSGALAQDAAAPANITTRNTIETVVVTAEKRSQDSQTVPISMSAIGGAQLEQQGITNLGSLTKAVPSLRFGPNPTGGENQIVIRGMGNQNVTPFGESNVAYNADGVYMGRSTSIDPEFFDIERIEVLRGPQGTLYGRNSTGGSINVITNKPTDELSGHVDALLGDYNARIFRAWANVPLYSCGDCKILARITGVSANHDPYQKNLSTAPTATEGGDGQNYAMIRGQLLFEFNADVSLLLSATTNSEKSPVAVKYRWDEIPAPFNDRYTGAVYPTDPREINADYPLRADNWGHFFAATLNWNLGWAQFTSTTAVSRAHWWQTADSDGSELPLSETPFWGSTSKQQSQEFRLASTDEASPLKWIAGVFLFREYADQTFYFEDTGFPFTPAAVAVHYQFDSPANLTTRSYALFGQVDYDLGKTSAEIPLTITAGLRYTHDNKYGKGAVLYGLPLYGLFFPSYNDYNANWAQITGKFGLSYQINEDAMIFASVSKGYHAGGFLVVLYNPEKIWSYETGFKSQWFDDRFQLNGNVFHSEITNMQIFIQDGTGTRMQNAGKAHVTGLELEAVAIPVDGLRLNAEVSLQEAEYDDYFAFDGRYASMFPPGLAPIENNKGHRLNQVPKWTFNVGAQYAIQTDIGTFTPRADVFFSSDLYFAGPNKPLDRQKAYTFVDVSMNYTEPKGRYSVDAFVRNLTNKDVLANQTRASASLGLGIEPSQNVYYPPRTVGVRLGVNF